MDDISEDDSVQNTIILHTFGDLLVRPLTDFDISDDTIILKTGVNHLLNDTLEADFHNHYKACKKNPDHKGFIPIEDFNIRHLPERHRDKTLFESIKAVADLTVRVTVKFISPERPKFWPKTYNPYPFSDTKERDVTRTGTGLVCHVKKYTGGFDKKHKLQSCRCYKCRFSSSPSTEWGEISMSTARHVVFDELEARHMTCRLFFDSSNSPPVILDGWHMFEADLENDWCGLKCFTCDKYLLDALETMVGKYRKKGRELRNKYTYLKSEENTLAIIVSHPHGCSKLVSIGNWINRNEVRENGEIKDTYTTCTCPGSSGAYVISMGNTYDLPFSKHIHSGVKADGINFSGIGPDNF